MDMIEKCSGYRITKEDASSASRGIRNTILYCGSASEESAAASDGGR